MKYLKSLLAYINAIPLVQLYILVVGFSLFIRIYLYVFHPPYENLVTDARWYYQVAANLSNGDGLIYSQNPTAYRPPGTSFILAIFFRIFGVAPFVSASVFSAFFILLLAQSFQLANALFGKTAAKITLILVTIWPEWWFHSLMPMSDLLCTALFITFFNQMLRRPPGNFKTVIILGLTLALLIATRTVGIFAIPIMLWHYSQNFERIVSIRAAILCLSITLLALAPYLYRNFQEFGKPVLANNGGINLHIGHNPNTTGAYMQLSTPDALNTASEVTVNNWHRDQALAYMAANPLDVVVTIPKKLAYGFIYHIAAVQGYYQGVPQDKRQSRFFWMVISQVSYFLLLASLVILYTKKRAHLNDKARIFVYGLTAFIAITIAIYFGSDRFIMPLIPLWMMVLASWIRDWYERNIAATSPLI